MEKIWEIITIIAVIIGLIAGILTLYDYYLNKKVKLTWKIIVVIIFVISIPFGIYYQVEKRHNSEIEKIKSDYLVFDSEISSAINDNHTLSYSGYLSKLALILGFYKRHSNIYEDEYERLNNQYNSFKSLYEKKYINGEGIIFSTDINEIEDVVETGINNIKKIIEKNKNSN